MKNFPNGEYTDQTLYWLAESYYAQKKTTEAIRTLNRLANSFPESSKHAAALLKLGIVYEDINQTTNAKKALERLIKDHPDSDVAEPAKQRLLNLSKKRTKP